jgi:hypothetical protein
MSIFWMNEDNKEQDSILALHCKIATSLHALTADLRGNTLYCGVTSIIIQHFLAIAPSFSMEFETWKHKITIFYLYFQLTNK